MKRYGLLLLIIFLPFLAQAQEAQFKVLTFSKTEGYRHASISAGLTGLKKMAKEHFFDLDHTEDSRIFSSDTLNNYDVVILLNTTGDVFNNEQKEGFQAFLRSGKGVVGIHSATDTEYNWPWYNEMIGAQFESHPHIQTARVKTIHRHPSTNHLSSSWLWTDEWYNFKNFNDKVIVLLEVDESSYDTGKDITSQHPIAWFHDFDGGRVFYTGLGHTPYAYENTAFMTHLLGGIWYAAKPDLNIRYPVDGF